MSTPSSLAEEEPCTNSQRKTRTWPRIQGQPSEQTVAKELITYWIIRERNLRMLGSWEHNEKLSGRL